MVKVRCQLHHAYHADERELVGPDNLAMSYSDIAQPLLSDDLECCLRSDRGRRRARKPNSSAFLLHLASRIYGKPLRLASPFL
jgi:hypothetical protein